MGLFDKHTNPFDFIKKNINDDPLAPTRVKPDGTKVIEQESPYGTICYEIKPDGLVICMTYNKKNKLVLDWARRVNLEIGHNYNEDGKIIYEFQSYYDENDFKNLKHKTENLYEYHDNGEKSFETIIVTPGNIKTEIKYNEQGKQIEKTELKGSVKTFFDENNKPFKREIDRGSGGIVTENL